MGRNGTDVSREAATLVLTDDNFTTIVTAVRRGRTIFDNVVKFVRYQLTTNVGAILVVVTAALLGVARPFSAIHVLWVNLITDGPPGIALGVDPPGPGTMRRPPRRPGSAILTGQRLRVIALHAAVMAAGTLAVYAWAGTGTARAATLAFTTFVLFQVANAFNVRAEGASAFTRHSLTNVRLWAALITVVALQVVVVQVPAMHGAFHTTGLRPTDWVIATATALGVVAVEEARVRLAYERQARRRLDRARVVR
jgi:Ca2+-transporting ATPase